MKLERMIILFSTLIFLAANAFGQTGGNFAITQSVIASGGSQQTSGGIFALDSTTGQTLAGTNLTGGLFGVSGGFWLPQFAPTSAAVGVGGRAATVQGNGIRNVTVTLTDTGGASRTTRTGKFGLFRFDDVAAGSTYIISVSARHYQFEQPTIVLTVLEEITDLEFIANDRHPNWEERSNR